MSNSLTYFLKSGYFDGKEHILKLFSEILYSNNNSDECKNVEHFYYIL